MKINIKFHSSLIRYTGIASIALEVNSPLDIVSAISLLFPKLKEFMSKINGQIVKNILFFVKSDMVLLENKWFLRKELPENLDMLHVIPTIYGSGGKEMAIVLGIALIAAGFFLGPQVSLIGVTGMLTGSTFISLGISFLLGGVMQLLAPSNDASVSSDAQSRRENNAFSALQNSSSTSNPIPINYGIIRIPGQFISGYIRTVNHDKNTTVKVSDYVS